MQRRSVDLTERMSDDGRDEEQAQYDVSNWYVVYGENEQAICQ